MVKRSSGILGMTMGNSLNRCACLMSLFACIRSPYVGLLVAEADSDTRAARSGREFVTSHCKEPLIARKHLCPFPSSRLAVSVFLYSGGSA